VRGPNAFNTTRYSEKLLEQAGISVNTIDLSEVFGRAAEIETTDTRVKQRIELIRSYADSSAAPEESMVKMAKFAVVVDEWMERAGPHGDGHPVLEQHAEELRRECMHHHEHDERADDAKRMRG
jgi:molecular chaperone DnaK (HSP70)